MKASDVLAAIHRQHPGAAIVHEVLLDDPGWGNPRRIDALMFKSLDRTAIEVKVTKADYLRDVHEKRYPWQRVTHRFVYAVPAGLIDTAPYKCGLWWVHEDGRVEIVQKAAVNRNPEPLPQHVIQALAYRAMKMQESK